MSPFVPMISAAATVRRVVVGFARCVRSRGRSSAGSMAGREAAGPRKTGRRGALGQLGRGFSREPGGPAQPPAPSLTLHSNVRIYAERYVDAPALAMASRHTEGSAMIEPELIPLVAKRFKALGEPARLALLVALQQGERSVSELVEATHRGQPNVSQHLKELVHAGLISPRRDGNHVYYRIVDRHLMRICSAVCKSITEPEERGRPARRSGRRRSVSPAVTPGVSRG